MQKKNELEDRLQSQSRIFWVVYTLDFNSDALSMFTHSWLVSFILDFSVEALVILKLMEEHLYSFPTKGNTTKWRLYVA